MTNPLRTEKSTSLGLLLARLPMGAFFLLAGISKIRMGIDNFVSFATSNGTPPHAIPADWVHTYLHAFPFLEIAVGTLLIVGLIGRVGALVGALMVISIVVGFTGIKDPNLPFHPNLIYLGILLLIFLAGPGRISVDGALFGRGKKNSG